MKLRTKGKLIAGTAIFITVLLALNFIRPAKPYNVMANEIIELRDPYSKRFLNEDGTITANISLAPIHYKNEEGSYEEIDLAIAKEKNGDFEYAASKNTFRSYFNASDSIEDYNMAGFDIVNNLGKTRSVKYKLLGADPKGHSFKEDQFKYYDVFEDIDLEYIVSSERLKENVIVKKPISEYKFSFMLEMDNDIYLEELENGAIDFIDRETDEVLWKIEKPYAEDSSQEKLYTQKARYELGTTNYNGKEYSSISLILEDDEFLKKAKFPVIIDPTGYLYDTNAKTWSLGSEEDDEETTYLKVGYNRNKDGCWYFAMKFDVNLNSNVIINSAELRLHLVDRAMSSDSEDKLDSVFNVYMIEQDWNNNSSVPMRGEMLISRQQFYDFKEGALNSIDITKAVQSWTSKANPSFGILAVPDDNDYTFCEFSKSKGGNIVVNYSEPVPDGNPKLKIVSPTKNKVLGSADTAFIPKISVSDANGDTLTCKCFIDKETTARSTKTVTGSANFTAVSFTAINIATLSDGPHTIRFEVSDGKSNPAILSEIFNKAGLKYESSISSIRLIGFGMTNNDSFDGYSYKYTIGTFNSGWITKNEYTQYKLTPNTTYSSKIEIEDMDGQVRSLTQNIYTKAQTPVPGISKATTNSFDFYVTDTNPAITKYQLVVNDKYVTTSGALTTTATWIPLTNKKITVTGLSPGILCKIKVKARNEQSVETPFGNYISVMTLK